MLDAKVAPVGPAPAGESLPPRPLPKPRPRLVRPMVDQTGKRVAVDRVVESPQFLEGNKFLEMLSNRISIEWDKAMREESADWHPEIEVQFIFSVDAEKGAVAIEAQFSPPGTLGLERFRKLLESLAPIALPESLRSLYGKEVRFRLDFKNTKELSPTIVQDSHP